MERVHHRNGKNLLRCRSCSGSTGSGSGRRKTGQQEEVKNNKSKIQKTPKLIQQGGNWKVCVLHKGAELRTEATVGRAAGWPLLVT